jgi:hypothetical protein
MPFLRLSIIEKYYNKNLMPVRTRAYLWEEIKIMWELTYILELS